MYKIRTTNLQLVTHQATGKQWLDVSFEIFKEGTNEQGEKTEEILSEQKHWFDPVIDVDGLKEEARKLLTGFIRDQEFAEKNKESDALNAKVQDMQEKVVGLEIKNEDKK